MNSNKEHEKLHSHFNIKEEVEAELELEPYGNRMGTIELCQDDDSSSENDEQECEENQSKVLERQNVKDKCEICGLVFDKLHHLKYHIKTVHEVLQINTEKENFQSKFQKKFKNFVGDTDLTECTKVITTTKSTKCVPEIYADTSKILPNVQNVPKNSVNISTSNLRAYRKKSHVFKENKMRASESQDANNVHEGPKLSKLVQNQDLKQKHNCNFCQEVFGKYPNESFTFDGCFLP